MESHSFGPIAWQYGRINAIDGNSWLKVRFEELIFNLEHIFPLIADRFGLALKPCCIIELRVIMHVMVDTNSNHLAIKVKGKSKVVFDALFQLIKVDRVNILIC